VTPYKFFPKCRGSKPSTANLQHLVSFRRSQKRFGNCGQSIDSSHL